MWWLVRLLRVQLVCDAMRLARVRGPMARRHQGRDLPTYERRFSEVRRIPSLVLAVRFIFHSSTNCTVFIALAFRLLFAELSHTYGRTHLSSSSPYKGSRIIIVRMPVLFGTPTYDRLLSSSPSTLRPRTGPTSGGGRCGPCRRRCACSQRCTRRGPRRPRWHQRRCSRPSRWQTHRGARSGGCGR